MIRIRDLRKFEGMLKRFPGKSDDFTVEL